MRRVTIVGSSGSGKSTLAAQIADRLGLSRIELDELMHGPNWTPTPTPQFRATVLEAMSAADETGWVVAGNYRQVADITQRRADTIVWLDLPRRTVTRRVVVRSLRRAITREKLFNGNTEQWRNLFSRDQERNVVLWSWNHHHQYTEIYDGYAAGDFWAQATVHRLRTAAEVEEFLDGIRAPRDDIAARDDPAERRSSYRLLVVTDTERLEHDRLIALQRLLLPQSLPAVGCTEVAAGYQAHNEHLRLGGDWYDLIDRPDDQVVAIVGDVVGHGIEQIGVMGQLRAAANALGRSCSEPHEILEHLDDFARDTPGAAMATVVVMMLDGSTTGRIAAAGHPPPLHVPANGTPATLEVGRRPPLTFGDGTARTGRFEYDIDDLLLLFTDGLVERRSAAWDDRVDRLGRLVAARFDDSCAAITDALMDDAATDGEDDVALMVLRPRNHRAPDHLLRRQDIPNVRIR